jgi:LmbE family N-acetylglucosaminyl deacetylase
MAPPPSTPAEELALEVDCTPALDRKLAALGAHRSQTRSLEARVGPATFREWWATESFVRPAPARIPVPAGLPAGLPASPGPHLPASPGPQRDAAYSIQD